MAIIAIVAMLTILPFLAESYMLFQVLVVASRGAHGVHDFPSPFVGILVIPMLLNIALLVQTVEKVRKAEPVSIWKLLGVIIVNAIILAPVAYVIGLHG